MSFSCLGIPHLRAHWQNHPVGLSWHIRERSAEDVTTRMISDFDLVEQPMIDFIVSGFTDARRLAKLTIVLPLMKPILGRCVLVALEA